MRYLLLPLLLASPLVAEEDKIEPRRLIVVKAETRLMLKQKVVARARAGELLTATRASGSWLWIPALDGWVEKTDVLSPTQALAHFSSQIRTKRNAMAFEHRARAHYAMGKYNKALADLGEALKIEPKRVSALVMRGLVWQQGGNYKQAVADYGFAIKLNPKSAAALNNRASLLIELNELAQAEKDVAASLKIKADQPAALNNRGELLRKRGRNNEALLNFNRAIRLQTSYSAAYMNRAVILESQGRYKQAISDYQLAIKYNPEFAQAYNNFAWLKATCKDKKLRDGDAAVKLALEANRIAAFRDWNFLDTLAAAYAEAGQFPQAVKYAKDALKLVPAKNRSQVSDHLRRFESKRTVAN